MKKKCKWKSSESNQTAFESYFQAQAKVFFLLFFCWSVSFLQCYEILYKNSFRQLSCYNNLFFQCYVMSNFFSSFIWWLACAEYSCLASYGLFRSTRISCLRFLGMPYHSQNAPWRIHYMRIWLRYDISWSSWTDHEKLSKMKMFALFSA